jgi:ketosteroid isomerase-like protein
MTKALRHEKDALRENHGIWIEISRTGAVDKLDQILAEDVVLMPPNEPSLYGKTEVKEWFSEYFRDFRIASITETDRDIVVTENLAVEHWTYMVAIDPVDGSSRIRDDGRFITIWKQQADGGWKITHTIWNSVRPIGSGTSRFLSRMKKRG